MKGFYSKEQLLQIGLKSFGDNVLISNKCSIYGIETISIGHNVRIDDFCILSGNIKLGNFVHIAAYCGFFGGAAGIELKNFTGVSAGSCLHAQSDDFTGEYLTNPTIPEKYKKIERKKILLEEHALIGSGCRILPGVTISEGTAVGALSLVTKNTLPWKIYFGIPARPIKDRSKKLKIIEQKLLNDYSI